MLRAVLGRKEVVMPATETRFSTSRPVRLRTRCEPRLAYVDPEAALAFLTSAFGALERARIDVRGDDLMVWLGFGQSTLMIGGSGAAHHNLYSPRVTGMPTAEVNVAVDDIDGHYQRAQAAGAVIAASLEDAPFGQRHYRAIDIEGHGWHFMKPLADVHTMKLTRERLELRLFYADLPAALTFLTGALGLVEQARIKSGDGSFMAWLGLDDALVMISPADPARGQHSPMETGRPSAMFNLYVDEIDRHFERTVAAGARIVTTLENTPWGMRRYEAIDPEGNRWHMMRQFT